MIRSAHSKNPLLPIYLTGPTASGKSALALHLARRFNGEIISVDSMQVYRGMDIGTAKPAPEERAEIPHHLIDVVELGEPFDAARFKSLAETAQAEIQNRGKRAIFCGGTGLYFKALLFGLHQGPGADPQLRAALDELPTASLCQELEARDPITFASIDRKNRRRLVRALEVIRLTGLPASSFRTQWNEPCESSTGLPPPLVLAITRDRADLVQRIDARVERMFAAGLVHETELLVARGLRSNPIACQALGYRQVLEFFDGERNLADTTRLVQTRTRQFAKRQMTWFRHQLPVQWISAAPGESEIDLGQKVAAVLKLA